MPGSVTAIGDSAFAYCTSLTSITFPGMVAPTSVSSNWLSGTGTGLFGHAFAASNFPPSGSVVPFHGLIMGTNLPALTPGAPTGLVAKQGDGQISLSWTAPTVTGASDIDYYIVYQNGVEAVHTSSTFTNITGLTNGQNYTITVCAHNSAGVGNRSSPQIISPSAGRSNSRGTIGSGNDDIAYSVALVTITAALIAIFLLMRRNRKENG
jgi:hypothetical protein